MIRRILLPVDGSTHSRAAARYAEQLARQHDATIYALGIVDVPSIERSARAASLGASYYAKDLREHRLDDARHVLERILIELQGDLAARGIRVHVVSDSGPVHEIIEQRSRWSDLVLVARGSNFQFETSDRPGDTLFKLLDISSRPVMVVPDEQREIRRVLFAHDMSRGGARLLYVMVQLRLFPQADFLIVHADPEGLYDPEDFADGIAYLGEHGIRAEIVVRNLEPTAAILEAAAERQADAIVLGVYHGGKVRRLLLGSTAQDILEQARLPLVFGS